MGTEFCNAESPAIYDSSVWVVTIGKEVHGNASLLFLYSNVCMCIADITAPHLQFVNAPVFSNQNLTLSWMYDENTTSFCTLQSPASLTIIPCSDNVAVLTNLQEGYHSFFIQGTDTSGNTAATLRHTWRVGMFTTIDYSHLGYNHSILTRSHSTVGEIYYNTSSRFTYNKLEFSI